MNGLSRLTLPYRSSGGGEWDEQALSVSVVFTNEPATMIAVQRAAELASRLGAQIRIIVPLVVP